jgi:hypothetical protein
VKGLRIAQVDETTGEPDEGILEEILCYLPVPGQNVGEPKRVGAVGLIEIS